jgi:hypothetical protein
MAIWECTSMYVSLPFKGSNQEPFQGYIFPSLSSSADISSSCLIKTIFPRYKTKIFMQLIRISGRSKQLVFTLSGVIGKTEVNQVELLTAYFR